MNLFLRLVVALAVLALPSWAQSVPPSLLHLQARLANAAGTPLQGPVNLEIRIYDAATAGNLLWSENQTVTALDGVVSLLLGATTPVDPTLFDGTVRFLALKVGTDPEMTPRRQIASIPFAMRAGRVAALDAGTTIPNGLITSAHLLDLSVSTADLADGAVTTPKIALGAVNGSAILDGAVGSADLADGSVTSTKIAGGAVGSTALAANSVATAAIQSNAVSSAKLQDGSVTSLKIADLGVASADLADGAVTSAKIGAGAVGAGALAPASVAEATLQNNAVSTAKIQAGAIGSAQIADLGVATADLANNAVTSAKIAASAVGSAQIADLGVGTADLADGSVTSVKIADGSVTSIDVANGSLHFEDVGPNGALAGQVVKFDGVAWTAGIDNGTAYVGTTPIVVAGSTISVAPDGITAAQLAPDSVGASEIATGAVGTSEIADLGVETADLAAAAVTSAKLAAGAVTTAAIAADAVGSPEIANGAITNADVSLTAAISGTKVAPNFGSQTISTSGMAGFGTATPASRLHVRGPGGVGALAMIEDTNDAASSIEFATSILSWHVGQNQPPDDLGATDAFFIHNASDGVTRLLIEDATGRIGVGTTSPTARVHVIEGVSTTAFYANNTVPSGVTIGVRGEVSSVFGDAVLAVGDLTATGTKSFVQPHPTDPTKEIRFVCLEGNESGTYFRGSSQLVNGRAVIEVPEEFRLVTDPEGLTVQLTPVGAPTSLWIESESLERIVVRADRDVRFHYFVNGVRRGFQEFEAVDENRLFVPEVRGVPYGTQYPEALRQILVENGTLNGDFTPNEETAERLGRPLRDPSERPERPRRAATEAPAGGSENR